jgi:hypothetical protein
MPRYYNSSYSRNGESYLEKPLGSKTVGMRCDSVWYSLEEVLSLLREHKEDPDKVLRYVITTKCTVRPSKDAS